jgi:hypothetical protein
MIAMRMTFTFFKNNTAENELADCSAAAPPLQRRIYFTGTLRGSITSGNG